VATPAVLQQSLEPWLDPGATQLYGPDIIGRNCVDNGNCIPVMGINVHFCDFVSTATVNPTGDFLDLVRPPTDLEPEDAFAEVQMFWHANRGYQFFRGFGFTQLNQHPMQAMANLRIPDLNDLAGAICLGSTTTPGGLVPIDNAAFFAAGSGLGFPEQDMIIFGQGTNIDFAYDGDVVYHELTHAVMATVAPDYEPFVKDLYGLDLTPQGTFEGFSDYFAAALTNDPGMGDYAGPGVGTIGPLRSAENTKRCPDDLWGESHQDGEPWLGALWDIRRDLAPAEQALFDQAVFTVMDALDAGQSPVGDVSTAIAAEVEVVLGPATADVATAAFAARGYDDCDNRVIALAQGAAKDVLNLVGTDYFPMDAPSLVPAVVQFRVEVPEDSVELSVAIAGTQSLGGGIIPGGGSPDVKLLVKRDEQILWTWAADGTHDATATGDVTLQMGGTNPGAGTITGEFPAGTYYFQLANAGASVLSQGVSFSHTPGNITPDAGVPDASPPDAGNPVDGDGGGCGCRAGGGATGGTLFVLVGVAAFLIVLLRRRRP
jgi:MYXO-CTERM domain-containing protein